MGSQFKFLSQKETLPNVQCGHFRTISPAAVERGFGEGDRGTRKPDLRCELGGEKRGEEVRHQGVRITRIW